jgi:preprotein translocase subunit SecA
MQSFFAITLNFLFSIWQEIVEKQAPGLMKEAERFLILSNIDRLWKEHLQALKFVQQAVGLRGYAQRDPLIEYKLEGYNLFLDMMAQIRRNVIYSVYQVSLSSDSNLPGPFSVSLENKACTLQRIRRVLWLHPR